jgi:WD40 repeat protein
MDRHQTIFAVLSLSFSFLSPCFINNTSASVKLSMPADEFDTGSTGSSTYSSSGDMPVTSALITTTLSDPGLFEQRWAQGLWGAGIGASNLLVEDLDGDGQLELIAGASSQGGFWPNDYWYVVSYNTQAATYEQSWLSKPLPAIDPYTSPSIQRIIVADPDGSGNRIYVADSAGTLHVYSAAPIALETTAAIPLEVADMVAGDLDQDGVLELILSTGTSWSSGSIYVYDSVTLSQKAVWLDVGAQDIAVGQLDNDPALEIVTASTPGRVIDGITGMVEWSYAAGFGANVEVGNLDDDPVEEFVAAQSWYYVTAFDAVVKSPLWEIPVDLDVDACDLVDVNGDSRDELLIGEGQWGSILVYDTLSQTLMAALVNPEHGTTDVNAGDLDQDGMVEVVWGAGYSSTGEDILAFASLETEQIEWSSTDIGGPLAQVDVGDVDADGEMEIVMASFESRSGYDDGIIFVFDAITHALEWQSEPILGGLAWTGIHQLRLANLDADNQLEIIVGTDLLYDGVIKVYDGLTHEVQLQTDPNNYSGAPVYSLDIADADGDGSVNIVAGLGKAHTGAEGLYLLVLDPLSGAELWRSINLSTGWSEVYDVEVANLDSDGNPELIASVAGESVWVFDGATKLLQWNGGPAGARAVHAFDADNDGDVELVIGTDTGEIRAYDPLTWQSEWNTTLTGSIDCLDGAATASAEPLILVCADGMVHTLDGATRQVLWTSDYLGTELGLGNHLPIADSDRDDAVNLWVGSSYALFEFEEYRETLQTGADLSVTLSAFPDPVMRGSETIYTVEIGNAGPEQTEEVKVKLNLPRGFFVLEVDAEQADECERERREAECEFETLAGGETVVMTARILARRPGEHSSTVTVVSEATTDPITDNNTASLLTTVLRPTRVKTR